MYNFTSSPWKTQKQVARILEEEYDEGAGGLSGNDDAGQMSAWYVFASLGFYPVDPVSGNYQLTTPALAETTITFENGKRLKIKKISNGQNGILTKSITFNGRMVKNYQITHNELIKGGELIFVLN